jgi:hypothetical protein
MAQSTMEMVKNGPNYSENGRKWPTIIMKWPKMAKNYYENGRKWLKLI